MPSIDLTVSCPVYDSFRVQQVAGMFDVPITQRASERFRLDLPDLGEDWKLGLIVGPSGSGKSTIARELFGECLFRREPWPDDRAVVDCLGDRPIKEITALFTTVGFSSPPSWIKPYRVLSNGEQFRCDLARALAEGCKAETGKPKAEAALVDRDQTRQQSDHRFRPSAFGFPLVAFDEFTSVVDRNVARIVSAAIAKGVRSNRIGCRFVAVTCHYDVTEWLTPDWVIDMASSTFSRRCLQRPKIHLEIFRCRRRVWRMFARHHYLSGSIARAARCFLALWEGSPVTFCATIPILGRRGHRRFTRIVTLPDYQGVGIGTAVLEAVAQLHRRDGDRINVTASHPAMVAHCRRAPQWRAVSVKRTGSASARRFKPSYRGSGGRAVVSFEYVGAQGARVGGQGSGLPTDIFGNCEAAAHG